MISYVFCAAMVLSAGPDPSRFGLNELIASFERRELNHLTFRCSNIEFTLDANGNVDESAQPTIEEHEVVRSGGRTCWQGVSGYEQHPKGAIFSATDELLQVYQQDPALNPLSSESNAGIGTIFAGEERERITSVWRTKPRMGGWLFGEEPFSKERSLAKIFREADPGRVQITNMTGHNGLPEVLVDAELLGGSYHFRLAEEYDFAPVEISIRHAYGEEHGQPPVPGVVAFECNGKNIEYQLVDGLWLPASGEMTHATTFRLPSGKLQTSKLTSVCQFSDSQIIGVQPPERFEIAWPANTYIHDKGLGIQYAIDADRKRIPVADGAIYNAKERLNDVLTSLSDDAPTPAAPIATTSVTASPTRDSDQDLAEANRNLTVRIIAAVVVGSGLFAVLAVIRRRNRPGVSRHA